MTKNEGKEIVNRLFQEHFGCISKSGSGVFFAPGRINLIGEHTDYNGGHVLPCAVSLGTYGLFQRRSDRKLRFYSGNEPGAGVIETSLDELQPDRRFGWAEYPKGVLWAMKEEGFPIETGFDMAIYGDLPGGAGLSSSASLEILTGFAVRGLFDLDISDIKLALLGQKAENEYCGVRSGIMDQFASALGRKDHAIFLNTADLSYQYVPIRLPGAKIVISNTNRKHKLADSVYNERRRECQEALDQLKKAVNIQNLCDLTPEEFEQHRGVIQDPVLKKRARHVVYENARTLEAAKALKKGNISRFGGLMNEAHESMRRDYEATGIELDTLQEEALKIPGVIGSRMTGAGFGGCTVSIAEDSSIDRFIQEVGDAYLKEIGYAADFYIAEIGSGPRRL
ncbi:MAG: galactokinase [Eubacteriales bacterium]|nr:galactokinase [Eubacteriales bacterium]